MNPNPKSVLVIEDEVFIRRLIERVLTKLNVNLVFCGSLQEGLQKIAGSSYDLLITDLRLPDGHGVEGVRAFRKKSARAPILVITGSPTPERHFEEMEPIVTQWINKPFEINDLEKTVTRLLALSALSSS